jgi:hypothetical protein
MSPIVTLNTEPFPHVIIDDFYDEEELKKIFKEIDYLFPKLKVLGRNLGTAFDIVSGEPLSSGNSLCLDEFFNNKQNSDIVQITDKVLLPELLFTIADVHPLYGHAKNLNVSNTTLKYYNHKDKYKSHMDYARFTFLSWFCKEPKAFEGGDLVFQQFNNYKIEFKNNRGVFFCGAVYHESTPLKFNKNAKEDSGKFVVTKFLNFNERFK